jgi:Domain of unknown function (DUF4440)
MKRLLVFVLFSLACFSQTITDEEKVWDLEHEYWRYVQNDDMKSYRLLWHENFVGWPSSSPEPARKNHITDWYDNIVKRGLKMKSWHLEQVAFQLTEPVAVTHYRLRYVWVDKSGKEESKTFRVHHTWLRTSGGWQIIAGMSAPTDKDGK